MLWAGGSNVLELDSGLVVPHHEGSKGHGIVHFSEFYVRSNFKNACAHVHAHARTQDGAPAIETASMSVSEPHFLVPDSPAAVPTREIRLGTPWLRGPGPKITRARWHKAQTAGPFQKRHLALLPSHLCVIWA